MSDAVIECYRRDFFGAVSDGWPLQVLSFENVKTLTQLHTHDFLELVIITGGTGIYRDDAGNSYALTPGRVFVLLPGMVHAYTEQHNLTLTNILWAQNELEIPLYDLVGSPGYHALFELEPQNRSRRHLAGSFELDPDQMREVLEIIERMHRELRLRIPGSKLMLVCLFGRLVTLLCRAYESSSGNEAGDLGNIDRAVSYIHRNYAKRISRGELARLTGMSESSFYRLFLRLIGCTPMEYLVRTRFLYAGKMLLETSRDLSSIARSCGFSDSNYFGTRFRERYGETPHQYRTRMRRKAVNTEK